MKYISVAQAAKKLSVSTTTIYNYCRAGLLAGRYIKVNQKGTWQIDAQSLDELIDNSTFNSVKETNQISFDF